MLGANLLRALLRINPLAGRAWRDEELMELWIRAGALWDADEKDRKPVRVAAVASLDEANMLWAGRLTGGWS